MLHPFNLQLPVHRLDRRHAGQVQPHLFADAGFAGMQRSASGLHLVIRGPNRCCPISWARKLQSRVSRSTLEAEMASMDHALRHCGLPCLVLWHAILLYKPVLLVHEDNQAMIKVVQSGYNPTMRYLGWSLCGVVARDIQGRRPDLPLLGLRARGR